MEEEYDDRELAAFDAQERLRGHDREVDGAEAARREAQERAFRAGWGARWEGLPREPPAGTEEARSWVRGWDERDLSL